MDADAAWTAIFEGLARWRQLPDFRLGPRLAPYLLEFVRRSEHQALARCRWHPEFLPDFPLALGPLVRHGYAARDEHGKVLAPDVLGTHRTWADFALFGDGDDDGPGHGQVLLLRLEPELAELDHERLEALAAARRCAFAELIVGLRPVITPSRPDVRLKFRRLLAHLERLGAIHPITARLTAAAEDDPRADGSPSGPRFERVVADLRATDRYRDVDIAYLVPTRSAVLERAGLVQLAFDELAPSALAAPIGRNDPVAGLLCDLLLDLGTT